MLWNYIKIALRSLRRQALFSAINVLGLAAGMTGFAVFAVSIGVKLNADEFHRNADQIHVLVENEKRGDSDVVNSSYTAAPLGPEMLRAIPEIEQQVRVFSAGTLIIHSDNMSFYEPHGLLVDSNFFQFFDFELIAGNAEDVLRQPHSMVLSQTLTHKYFGDGNPVGETLQVNDSLVLQVTGVMKDIPRTSSLRFEMAISIPTAADLGIDLLDWTVKPVTCFFQTLPGADTDRLSQNVTRVANQLISVSPELNRDYTLYPLLKIRLDGSHIHTILATSHRIGLIVLLAIGVLLLMVVSINFINLSIARYMQRIQEVGLRKIIGASRWQLILQFLGESVLLALIALPVMALFFEFIYPKFLAYIGSAPLPSFANAKHGSIWSYPFILQYMLTTALFVGIVSGLYPALYLSSWSPRAVIRGEVIGGKTKHRLSRVLIILQFVLSILFITTAGVLTQQYEHLFDADFGFNRNDLTIVRISGLNPERRTTFLDATKNLPSVENLTTSGGIPMIWMTEGSAYPTAAGPENPIKVEAFAAGPDFLEVMEIPLLLGEPFTGEMQTEVNFIISQSAMDQLQMDAPVGQLLTLDDRSGRIVGVAENFLFGDIGFREPASILFTDPDNLNYVLIRTVPGTAFSDTRDQLETLWENIAPRVPFECTSLDTEFQEAIGLFAKIAVFLRLLGLAAIFFSCLGLVGLSAYMMAGRKREIGIRKVLGAGIPGILGTIVREYVVLVLIANAIGLALVTLAWREVLKSGQLFMFELGPSTYIGIPLLTVSVTLVAVLTQTLRTAMANPLDALRRD